MTVLDFRLSIVLRSPLHIGTGTGLASLIDEQTVRGPSPNSDTQVPYLPASSLKGRLRRQLAEVADALGIRVCKAGDRCPEWPPCASCLLFGAPDREGILRLEDGHLMEPEWSLATEDKGEAQPLFLTDRRHFVGISRRRGVARAQQLAHIEQVARGSAFEVAGRARFVPPFKQMGQLQAEGTAAPQALGLFVAAVELLTHLGGHKARGLGLIDPRWLALSYGGQELEPRRILEALRGTPGGEE